MVIWWWQLWFPVRTVHQPIEAPGQAKSSIFCWIPNLFGSETQVPPFLDESRWYPYIDQSSSVQFCGLNPNLCWFLMTVRNPRLDGLISWLARKIIFPLEVHIFLGKLSIFRGWNVLISSNFSGFHVGVSSGYRNSWMVYHGKSDLEMDDFGVSPWLRKLSQIHPF